MAACHVEDEVVNCLILLMYNSLLITKLRYLVAKLIKLVHIKAKSYVISTY